MGRSRHVMNDVMNDNMMIIIDVSLTVIPAYKLTGHGIAIIYYHFHLSGVP